MKIKITAIALTALILPVVSSADIIWDGLTNWVSITIGGSVYNDPADQNPGSVDLIGNSTKAAGFWQFSEGLTPAEDIFAFRLRVSALPNNPQNVWQILFETDGDETNVEWILQLNYSGKDDGVFLTKTATGGDGPSLGAITTVSTNHWEGTTAGYSQMTLAGTDLDGQKDDAFIDLGVPWQEFSQLTGAAAVDQLRVAVTTSTTHTGVNKDAPLGTDGPALVLVSDTLSDTIPEPAVVSLLLGAGGGMIFYRRIFRRKAEEES